MENAKFTCLLLLGIFIFVSGNSHFENIYPGDSWSPQEYRDFKTVLSRTYSTDFLRISPDKRVYSPNIPVLPPPEPALSSNKAPERYAERIDGDNTDAGLVIFPPFDALRKNLEDQNNQDVSPVRNTNEKRIFSNQAFWKRGGDFPESKNPVRDINKKTDFSQRTFLKRNGDFPESEDLKMTLPSKDPEEDLKITGTEIIESYPQLHYYDLSRIEDILLDSSLPASAPHQDKNRKNAEKGSDAKTSVHLKVSRNEKKGLSPTQDRNHRAALEFTTGKSHKPYGGEGIRNMPLKDTGDLSSYKLNSPFTLHWNESSDGRWAKIQDESNALDHSNVPFKDLLVSQGLSVIRSTLPPLEREEILRYFSHRFDRINSVEETSSKNPRSFTGYTQAPVTVKKSLSRLNGEFVTTHTPTPFRSVFGSQDNNFLLPTDKPKASSLDHSTRAEESLNSVSHKGLFERKPLLSSIHGTVGNNFAAPLLETPTVENKEPHKWQNIYSDTIKLRSSGSSEAVLKSFRIMGNVGMTPITPDFRTEISHNSAAGFTRISPKDQDTPSEKESLISVPFFRRKGENPSAHPKPNTAWIKPIESFRHVGNSSSSDRAKNDKTIPTEIKYQSNNFPFNGRKNDKLSHSLGYINTKDTTLSPDTSTVNFGSPDMEILVTKNDFVPFRRYPVTNNNNIKQDNHKADHEKINMSNNTHGPRSSDDRMHKDNSSSGAYLEKSVPVQFLRFSGQGHEHRNDSNYNYTETTIDSPPTLADEDGEDILPNGSGYGSRFDKEIGGSSYLKGTDAPPLNAGQETQKSRKNFVNHSEDKRASTESSHGSKITEDYPGQTPPTLLTVREENQHRTVKSRESDNIGKPSSGKSFHVNNTDFSSTKENYRTVKSEENIHLGKPSSGRSFRVNNTDSSSAKENYRTVKSGENDYLGKPSSGRSFGINNTDFSSTKESYRTVKSAENDYLGKPSSGKSFHVNNTDSSSTKENFEYSDQSEGTTISPHQDMDILRTTDNQNPGMTENARRLVNVSDGRIESTVNHRFYPSNHTSSLVPKRSHIPYLHTTNPVLSSGVSNVSLAVSPLKNDREIKKSRSSNLRNRINARNSVGNSRENKNKEEMLIHSDKFNSSSDSTPKIFYHQKRNRINARNSVGNPRENKNKEEMLIHSDNFNTSSDSTPKIFYNPKRNVNKNSNLSKEIFNGEANKNVSTAQALSRKKSSVNITGDGSISARHEDIQRKIEHRSDPPSLRPSYSKLEASKPVNSRQNPHADDDARGGDTDGGDEDLDAFKERELKSFLDFKNKFDRSYHDFFSRQNTGQSSRNLPKSQGERHGYRNKQLHNEDTDIKDTSDNFDDKQHAKSVNAKANVPYRENAREMFIPSGYENYDRIPQEDDGAGGRNFNTDIRDQTVGNRGSKSHSKPDQDSENDPRGYVSNEDAISGQKKNEGAKQSSDDGGKVLSLRGSSGNSDRFSSKVRTRSPNLLETNNGTVQQMRSENTEMATKGNLLNNKKYRTGSTKQNSYPSFVGGDSYSYLYNYKPVNRSNLPSPGDMSFSYLTDYKAVNRNNTAIPNKEHSSYNYNPEATNGSNVRNISSKTLVDHSTDVGKFETQGVKLIGFSRKESGRSDVKDDESKSHQLNPPTVSSKSPRMSYNSGTASEDVGRPRKEIYTLSFRSFSDRNQNHNLTTAKSDHDASRNTQDGSSNTNTRQSSFGNRKEASNARANVTLREAPDKHPEVPESKKDLSLDAKFRVKDLYRNRDLTTGSGSEGSDKEQRSTGQEFRVRRRLHSDEKSSPKWLRQISTQQRRKRSIKIIKKVVRKKISTKRLDPGPVKIFDENLRNMDLLRVKPSNIHKYNHFLTTGRAYVGSRNITRKPVLINVYRTAGSTKVPGYGVSGLVHYTWETTVPSSGHHSSTTGKSFEFTSSHPTNKPMSNSKDTRNKGIAQLSSKMNFKNSKSHVTQNLRAGILTNDYDLGKDLSSTGTIEQQNQDQKTSENVEHMMTTDNNWVHNKERAIQIAKEAFYPNEAEYETKKSQPHRLREKKQKWELKKIVSKKAKSKNFPRYHKIPKTHFSCKKQKKSGYYADPETDCQVFHFCHENGMQNSFLCPNSSVFNQKILVCDWWVNVDCSESEIHDIWDTKRTTGSQTLAENDLEDWLYKPPRIHKTNKMWSADVYKFSARPLGKKNEDFHGYSYTIGGHRDAKKYDRGTSIKTNAGPQNIPVVHSGKVLSGKSSNYPSTYDRNKEDIKTYREDVRLWKLKSDSLKGITESDEKTWPGGSSNAFRSRNSSTFAPTYDVNDGDIKTYHENVQLWKLKSEAVKGVTESDFSGGNGGKSLRDYGNPKTKSTIVYADRDVGRDEKVDKRPGAQEVPLTEHESPSYFDSPTHGIYDKRISKPIPSVEYTAEMHKIPVFPHTNLEYENAPKKVGFITEEERIRIDELVDTAFGNQNNKINKVITGKSDDLKYTGRGLHGGNPQTASDNIVKPKDIRLNLSNGEKEFQYHDAKLVSDNWRDEPSGILKGDLKGVSEEAKSRDEPGESFHFNKDSHTSVNLDSESPRDFTTYSDKANSESFYKSEGNHAFSKPNEAFQQQYEVQKHSSGSVLGDNNGERQGDTEKYPHLSGQVYQSFDPNLEKQSELTTFSDKDRTDSSGYRKSSDSEVKTGKDGPSSVQKTKDNSRGYVRQLGYIYKGIRNGNHQVSPESKVTDHVISTGKFKNGEHGNPVSNGEHIETYTGKSIPSSGDTYISTDRESLQGFNSHRNEDGSGTYSNTKTVPSDIKVSNEREIVVTEALGGKKEKPGPIEDSVDVRESWEGTKEDDSRLERLHGISENADWKDNHSNTTSVSKRTNPEFPKTTDHSHLAYKNGNNDLLKDQKHIYPSDDISKDSDYTDIPYYHVIKTPKVSQSPNKSDEYRTTPAKIRNVRTERHHDKHDHSERTPFRGFFMDSGYRGTSQEHDFEQTKLMKKLPDKYFRTEKHSFGNSEKQPPYKYSSKYTGSYQTYRAPKQYSYTTKNIFESNSQNFAGDIKPINISEEAKENIFDEKKYNYLKNLAHQEEISKINIPNDIEKDYKWPPSKTTNVNNDPVQFSDFDGDKRLRHKIIIVSQGPMPHLSSKANKYGTRKKDKHETAEVKKSKFIDIIVPKGSKNAEEGNKERKNESFEVLKNIPVIENTGIIPELTDPYVGTFAKDRFGHYNDEMRENFGLVKHSHMMDKGISFLEPDDEKERKHESFELLKNQPVLETVGIIPELTDPHVSNFAKNRFGHYNEEMRENYDLVKHNQMMDNVELLTPFDRDNSDKEFATPFSSVKSGTDGNTQKENPGLGKSGPREKALEQLWLTKKTGTQPRSGNLQLRPFNDVKKNQESAEAVTPYSITQEDSDEVSRENMDSFETYSYTEPNVEIRKVIPKNESSKGDAQVEVIRHDDSDEDINIDEESKVERFPLATTSSDEDKRITEPDYSELERAVEFETMSRFNTKSYERTG